MTTKHCNETIRHIVFAFKVSTGKTRNYVCRKKPKNDENDGHTQISRPETMILHVGLDSVHAMLFAGWFGAFCRDKTDAVVFRNSRRDPLQLDRDRLGSRKVVTSVWSIPFAGQVDEGCSVACS